MSDRRPSFDVTNTVNITDPREACEASCAIIARRYPDADLQALRTAYDTFGKLFSGTLPGYVGCDTWYHDAQHSLDCALAMVRLMDGHDASEIPQRRLGARGMSFGVILALFHDAGYIRRRDEKHISNGAAFTLFHVGRSANFLEDFLPRVGFAAETRAAAQLVHFTGYEVALERIRVRGYRQRIIGHLLGTADLIAQMSDHYYLRKCYNFLYHEFELCGLAGQPTAERPNPVYTSREDLIRKTPAFLNSLFEDRLDGYFGGIYRYAEAHFGGSNPYMQIIAAHRKEVEKLIASGRMDGLKVRPPRVHAPELRKKLASRPPAPRRGGKATAEASSRHH